MARHIDTAELWADEETRRSRSHSRFASRLVIGGTLCAALLVTCSYVPLLVA